MTKKDKVTQKSIDLWFESLASFLLENSDSIFKIKSTQKEKSNDIKKQTKRKSKR